MDNGTEERKSSNYQSSSETESYDSQEEVERVQLPFNKHELLEDIQESLDLWNMFRDYCIDIAALNLHYIF